MEERGTRADLPMKPQVVTHELNKLLDDDAIIVTDSGTITTWVARHIDMRGTMMFSCSGNLATMACGIGYAIAAAIAHPEWRAGAGIGDGSTSVTTGGLVPRRKSDFDVKHALNKTDTLRKIQEGKKGFFLTT